MSVNVAEHNTIVQDYVQRAKTLPIPPHHISSELGQLLQLLVRSINGKNILEIGTMWGYSTWWLNQGIAEGAEGHLENAEKKIVTIEKQLKHYNLAKEFFLEAWMSKVELRYGDALDEVPQFADASFDFIFVDADRAEYPNFFPELVRLLKPGGLVVVDNMTVLPDQINYQAVQDMRKLFEQHADFTTAVADIQAGVLLAVKHQ